MGWDVADGLAGQRFRKSVVGKLVRKTMWGSVWVELCKWVKDIKTLPSLAKCSSERDFS